MLTLLVLLPGPATGEAKTVVSGQSTNDSPLVIDPTGEPTGARVDELTVQYGYPIMFIQKMPVTKLVTRITLGDLAQQPQCGSASVYNLRVEESPTGQVNKGTPGWLAASVAPQPLPAEPGKATWKIPPTVLRKGYGYLFVLQNKGKNCQSPSIRTWTHNEAQVNGGPAGCDAVEAQYSAYRMWHENGKADATDCPSKPPSGFDPSMPTGWLRIGSNTSSYVETVLTGGTPICNWSTHGTEPVYWRDSHLYPGWKEYVCNWSQFATPGESLKDGWYYAWGSRWLAGGPRDAYLKAWADEEDVATYYKPRLYFDTSESWRPLNLDQLFGEVYFGENPEGVAQHNACTEGVPVLTFTWPGCVEVLDPDQLMGEQLNDVTTRLDFQGFGENEAIEDYVMPGCGTEVELWDCAPGASAVYWRVTPADPVGEPTEEFPYRYAQYWMFYRVNSFSDAIQEPWSRHEGDWEAVAIAPSHNLPGAFDFASFSQHGHWYSYLRENLSCWLSPSNHSCGTEEEKAVGRPLEIFIANGSHANYGVPCSELIEFYSCGQNASSLPERGHDGAVAWSHNVSGSQGLEPMPGPGSWTYWNGKWGAHESSPSSPGWQPMFSEFWERCADNNEDCPAPSISSRPMLGSRGKRATAGRMIKGPFARSCENWFGGDVSSLLCARGTLAASVNRSRLGGTGRARVSVLRGDGNQGAVAARLDQSASAPGLSQALGAPLRPGDAIRLVAPRQQRWSLFLRAVSGRRLVEARFNRIRSGLAHLAILDGTPVLRLQGRDLVPNAIRIRPLDQPM